MAFVFDPAAESRELARRTEIGQLPDILRNTNLAGVIADIDALRKPVIPDAFSEAMKFSESTKLAARLAALEFSTPNPAEEASKLLCGSAVAEAAEVINREMTEFSAGLRALEEARLFGKKTLEETSPAATFEKFATGVTDVIPREMAKVSAGLVALDESGRIGKKMRDELSGASALSQLTAGLFDHPPFDDACATAMRQALGDWRDIAAFPISLLDAPLARSEFYYGLGFDRSLTDMPTPAYMDMVDAIDLRIPQPIGPAPSRPYLPELDTPVADIDDAGAVPHLNRKAYRKLYIVETSLRGFIDPLMCATYGSDWLQERMPELHGELERKRNKDIAAGRDLAPLMAYADFTDYHEIIVRRTHWNDVFRAYFQRKQDISESLLRLYPARNCTMHGRVVTREDYLLVLVEVNRILKAIRRTRH